ncbi:DUF2235 domain-containing protein [Moritella sp. 5]|uniref:phospholipase effector Tle1 domain-containing protein n=1 Tax=Moritella sp. 5 TaxID=2746231 RepID=UPI001BABEDA9|nr:DUF2235 domain-containing protein [Moritella sp. 5]QUM81127.1 DUF2235 domain-containing protein [Moritella sp. 5]
MNARYKFILGSELSNDELAYKQSPEEVIRTLSRERNATVWLNTLPSRLKRILLLSGEKQALNTLRRLLSNGQWVAVNAQNQHGQNENKPTFTNAYYKRVVDDVVLAPESTYEPVEPTAAFEYSIEITCAQDELNKYNVGDFSLQKTEKEVSRLSWKRSQTQDGFTLLTASVNVNEPKTLVRELFASCGGALIFHDVEPVNAGSGSHAESFIPVKPAVQVGELLGWPTEGFFYHFIDDALTHEYQLLGEGKWAFQATLSDADKLSDELLSKQTYSFILLPWKINRTAVARQHLLYLPQKMTAAQFGDLTPAWLDEHACLLDVDSIAKTKGDENILREEALDDQSNQPGDAQTNDSRHTVKTSIDTGKAETWADIATQHGLADKVLLNLNPILDQAPWLLQVGDVLLVSKEKDQAAVTKQDLLPPQAIESVGQAIRFANAYASQVKDRQLRHNIVAVLQDSGIPQSAPIINIHKVKPERTLRIGVFFDGTGQNNPNDAYKERWGNKSRTNVARLFEAYPEQEGESYAIYVSGVGTVDGIQPVPEGEESPVIDAGDDEKSLSQAFGVFDDTGAFRKWQSLLKRLSDILKDLDEKDVYQKIEHIEFDVFGFSRGAALARHFINAALEGIPDYSNQKRGPNTVDIYPNLLGNESHPMFDNVYKDFYQKDETRRVSVRFVGLFDTVGSFYWAGNDDEGNFELGLKEDAAKAVFQICASHEYRDKFPLTALDGGGEMKAFTDGIFSQEVFPGCHTDIGGGYPSKNQYGRTDLPERLNQPVNSTYNRKLIKTHEYNEREFHGDSRHFASWLRVRLKEERVVWEEACKEVHGEVKLDNNTLYYYHFIPISNALSGLTFKRMMQQGEAHGIAWDKDNLLPLLDYEEKGNIAESLWESIRVKKLGEISASHWKKEETQLLESYIHRPHDTVINPGYWSPMEAMINGITRDDDDNPKRQVFSNEKR